MRIVCISDTHRKHEELDMPEGDMLIYAGDGDWRTTASTNPFLDWVEEQDYKYKVIIAGNHDLVLEHATNKTYNEYMRGIASRDILYLQNSGAEVGGFNIWGSPNTPSFGMGWAFMKNRGNAISKVWERIPDNTDILITHGPPMYTLDMTMRGEPVGCWDLAQRVREIKPKLHVFGHIHSMSGIVEKEGTIYVNASVVDEHYQVVYEPRVVDL